MTNTQNADNTGLVRHMGLTALVFYGVGDILGAGIYGLIGKWAGVMGNAVWLSFLASFGAALLTGLSYASLGSRYPKAAGAAFITERAFHMPALSYVVGLAVVASGLTSMAAQSRAFSGYLVGAFGFAPPGAAGILQPASPLLWVGVILAFIIALTLVNLWGISISSRLNVLCTSIEAAGLLIVIAVGAQFWGSVNYFELPPLDDGTARALTGALILQGGVLTFYSFLGFEDMINVTEEVHDPRRNFPRAVVIALGIAGVIYVAVSMTAVSVLPFRELATSGQPLVDVVSRAAPAFPRGLFSLIALFAILNTALLNYIMGSRVVYGMARMRLLPAALGAVHAVRRTPHVAILVLAAIIVILAFAGDVKQLAAATSVLLLLAFMLVNVSLIVLQRRADEEKGAFEVPAFVPVGGALVSAAMVAHADPSAWKMAGVILAMIFILYAAMRMRGQKSP